MTNPKRKNFGITCTKEELDNIKLLNNKVSCAQQAARPEASPDGVPAEKAKLFIQAALDSLANYQWLQQDWWENIFAKYKELPNDGTNVYVDFRDGAFYALEGETKK